MAIAQKLLVIDDNEEILESITNFLRKKNYSVVTAKSGLDGLKLFEADLDEIALVVTDIVMPNITGVAITTMIKNMKDIPIIAITGYGEQPEALAKEAHADLILEKPFKLDTLESHIKKLLDKND